METEKKLTCRHIEASVMQEFKREKKCFAVAPSLVLPHGWEADVAALTSTGFCHEFEIKMSRSDFKADFKKYKGRRVAANKHDRLGARNFDALPAKVETKIPIEIQPTLF